MSDDAKPGARPQDNPTGGQKLVDTLRDQGYPFGKPPKPPWRLGTLGLLLTFGGAAMVVAVIAADATLAALGTPGGLPEGVTTPGISAGVGMMSSGGTLFTARAEGKNGG